MSEPFINDPADRRDDDLTEEEFKAAMGDSALELKLARGLTENLELWQSNSELRAENDRLITALGRKHASLRLPSADVDKMERDLADALKNVEVIAESHKWRSIRLEKAEAALREIAKQKILDEVEDPVCCDFEDGYTQCVEVARAYLSLENSKD